MRRGSLTDPLLHAHNPSASSSSGFAGSSGTSPYTNIGHSLSPNISRQSNLHNSYSPSYDNNNNPYQGNLAINTSNEVLPPFFKKTTKTLFPQQHGSGGGPASISPSSEINPNLPLVSSHQGTTGSGTPSVLGTKRKLEPLSESDSHADANNTQGGDYFAPEAPVIDSIRLSSTTPHGGDHATSSMPVNTAKRRASQPFIAGIGGDLLPTPAATASAAGSASATSSERRSSNESNELRPGPNNSLSNMGPETDARYANITPRQPVSMHPQDVVEVDTRQGYAFPPERPASSSQINHISAPHQEYYDSQPAIYSTRDYPASSSSSMPSYGPPSVQARIPSAGPLNPELRSKASTIFGAAAGHRPSYASNGMPVHPNAGGGSGSTGARLSEYHLKQQSGSGAPGSLPVYNGPASSTKEGAPHHRFLQAQREEQEQAAGGGGTSNLPYARSPALKVSHKIAERKRRKEMKELFDELRDCIPSMSIINNPPNSNIPQPPPADVGGRGIKSSKWEVLAKAVEYINKLQYENQELSNSVLELQRLNQAFQDELSLVTSSSGNDGSNSLVGSAAIGNGAGFGNVNGVGAADSVVQYQQDNQPYPHQQQQQHPLQPYQQQHQFANPAKPSPSPVSMHSMPPLAHHPHSMPAAVGGGSSAPSIHASSVQHSPALSTQAFPISAPPHMASHSFFGPNDSNTAQHFTNPSQRHFQPHHHHSRNVSLNSNHSGIMFPGEGGGAQFEHAGSAPPALQHHPHQLQHQQGNTASRASPIATHQNSQPFAHQPSHLPSDMLQHRPMQQQQQQQYAPQQRPGSIRSQHSSQSILSGGNTSHLSQSPQSGHVGVGAMHHQQQEGWVGSPYSQHQQQMRSGTLPPASAHATPMMSPLNATY